MFDWVRREWEKWKELCREEPEYVNASWLMEEGWEKWIVSPPLLNGSLIEIRGIGWTESQIVICGEPLNEDTDWDQTLHWRRTGIYREREEREFARTVADRLMGRHRLIAVDSGAGRINSQLANMAQQQANQFGTAINNLIGSIGMGGPYGLG